MKIEITNSNATELLSLLRKFPNGNVVAEDGKAYWEFNLESITESPPNQYGSITMQKPATQQNTFLKMFDTMAGYF